LSEKRCKNIKEGLGHSKSYTKRDADQLFLPEANPKDNGDLGKRKGGAGRPAIGDSNIKKNQIKSRQWNKKRRPAVV